MSIRVSIGLVDLSSNRFRHRVCSIAGVVLQKSSRWIRGGAARRTRAVADGDMGKGVDCAMGCALIRVRETGLLERLWVKAREYTCLELHLGQRLDQPWHQVGGAKAELDDARPVFEPQGSARLGCATHSLACGATLHWYAGGAHTHAGGDRRETGLLNKSSFGSCHSLLVKISTCWLGKASKETPRLPLQPFIRS